MYRLSQKQVDEIIELHEKGVSQRDIAKLRHHGRSTIRNYIRDYYEQMITRAINEYNKKGKYDDGTFELTPFGFLVIMVGAMILIMSFIYLLIN